MRIRSIVTSLLLVGSSLAFAQVCPPTAAGTVCLVPSPTPSSVQPLSSSQYSYYSASAQCPAGISAQAPVMMAQCPTGVVTQYPVTMAQCPPGMVMTTPTAVAGVSGYTTTGVQPICSTARVSPDTACILNEMAALRNDTRSLQGSIRAAAIELRGQMLITRANQLMADELLFRQQLAANPNLPNAQFTAQRLQNDAIALNRDIAQFNQELAMVPVDQRPYLSQQISTFDVVYWTPTMQRMAEYRTQFATTGVTTYQPAVAANPWLTNWQANYQASLSTLSTTPQTFASARWWGTPQVQVLGSTETFVCAAPMTMQGGTSLVLPAGAVIYIPANAVPMASTTTTTVAVIPPAPTTPTVAVAGTTETTTTTTTTPAAPAGTTGQTW